MDKEKIILLIVGAVIGFVVSLAKDWLMEGKKQKEKEKQFKREKLEEIFILLNKERKIIGDNLSSRLIYPYEKAMLGHISSSDISAQLSMLVRFYFENLESKYQDYIKISISLESKIMNQDEVVELNDMETYMNSYKVIIDLLVLESKML